jgi:hypothetical protein
VADATVSRYISGCFDPSEDMTRIAARGSAPPATPVITRAMEILDLCLGDRAPFGLIEFLTGDSGDAEES